MKDSLAVTLTGLIKLSQLNTEYRKQIQSLCQIISKVYLKANDIVSAGLIKLMAENYKFNYKTERYFNWYDDNNKDYYWSIAFFDRFASPGDIDKLIALMEKKSKTNFEKLLCKQDLPSKNALLDLKGTLALRRGDLQTANSAFSSLPPEYWKTTYQFNHFLDSDPFITPNMPKSEQKYHFNKTDLLKQLVNLEQKAMKSKKKAAEYYIKLGHFFYNASYWGNSWMMLSYCWTATPKYGSTTFGFHDVLFGDLLNANNFESSYYKCEQALKYYEKAEKSNPDKEQLAMIYFMKHCCNYNQFLWKEKLKDWGEEDGEFKPEYISELYTKYNKTETFRQIRCSLLDDFAFEMGIAF